MDLTPDRKKFGNAMSSQRGNVSRTRTQKYTNRTVFKNDLHDTSHRTKMINSLQVTEVCTRCKDIIEWKIKYKKYKPLSQPKTCVKCSQKAVKKAYHVICSPCSASLKICAKCLESKELVPAVLDEREKSKLDAEMKQMLQTLSERKRRAFLRFSSKKEKEGGGNIREELEEMLKKLVVEEIGDDFCSDFSDSGDDDDNDSLDHS